MLANNQLITRRKDQVSCELNNETVLLDIDSGSYFSLNETGNSIWQLIESPITFAELCEKLQEEYQVSTELCRSDVNALVRELFDKQLVELPD